MKRIATLFIFLWTIPLLLPAQNNTPTDSLERAFNTAATYKERVDILLNINSDILSEQPDQALVLYQKGLKMAQQMSDSKIIAQLMLCIADIYRTEKSNEYEAFEWYQKALDVAEKAAYYEAYADACHRIAFIYDHQGFRDKMYQYLLKAVNATEKTAFPNAAYATTLIYNYTIDNRINEAYAVGEKLLQLEKKGTFRAIDELLFYSYFLQVLKKMPDKAQSLKVYTNKIQGMLDTIDLENDAGNITNVAYVCLDVHRPEMAIKLANQLLNTKTKYKTKEINAYAYKYLAEAYEMLGNYPLSTQHYKNYAQAQVDFVTTALTNQSREKVLIMESEKALLVKQNEIDKQKWWVISVFCIAVVFLLGALSVYYLFKREQKIKQELANLNATKDKLFALLSHDLMSPMANFKNILMLTDFGLLSQTEFKAIAKDLSAKANNLHSMFENVLHWAITQLNGIKAQIEQTNIADIVNEQIGLLEPIAKGKQIDIQQLIPDDVTLTLDKNHLALIIRNLLQNALKFTNSGGSIVFGVSPFGGNGATEGGKKTITISDNGVGMTSETRTKLFKFNDNTHQKGTANEGGTGLGLILTKELVELNGGTINVESEVDKGTMFSLAFEK